MTDHEDLAEIAPADRNKVMKYMRYTALSLDRVCGNLLELTARLEAANFIPLDRKTRKHRNAQLKRHRRQLTADPAFVAEMVEKVAGHPSPDAIVASLFRDLEVRDVTLELRAKQADN
jgi:hypothetical protein